MPLPAHLIMSRSSHLLVDAVLQASQVEVGFSRKETESNAGTIGTSQIDSESKGESETEVGYGFERIRSSGSDQQGDHEWRKDAHTQPV
jgi:hypothetical protein